MDYQRLRRRAAKAARASRLRVAVVGSGMVTELQEALWYCYHEAFSESNSIAKRRPMMPGLHDVNVKMAIMDKLMSFFMICYLVMWLQRNEGVLWFMRGLLGFIATSD